MDGRTHYMAGLDALQVGDDQRAWDALFLCLCKTPDNHIAQRLMRQVESPPETFFRQEFTEYRVQAGDTLSKIAKEAYGDPFLFFALARYNGMDNPSRLRRGQVLRLPTPRDGEKVVVPTAKPATKPAPAPPADRDPPEVAADPPAGRYHAAVRVTLHAADDADPAPKVFYSIGEDAAGGAATRYTAPVVIAADATLRYYAEDRSGNRSPVRTGRYRVAGGMRLREARALRQQGELAAALAALEPLLAEDPGDAEVRALYRQVAVARADELLGDEDLLAARDVLQRAETAAGGEAVSTRLAVVERRIGTEQLLANAASAMDGGKYEVAYTALNQVLELDPAHAVARGKLVVVRSALIDRYSKRAMGAYRRQDLEESIRLWDRVLELDPGDETAQLRRAEAVHLQQRFQEKFQ